MWNQIEQSLQNSMARVVNKIATLLPGVLAFALAVLLFVAIGWALAWLTKKILSSARLDERMSHSGVMGQWTPQQSPSDLIARAVFWICTLGGVLLGLSAFEAAAAETGLATPFFEYMPRLISAAVLLFVGTMLARFLARSVLISAVNMNLQYARLLSAGVRWLILVLTAAMILDHLAIAGGIVDLAFGILFGGIVLALALAVGLGSRDLVSRSLEKEAVRSNEPAPEERLHHF